MLSSTVHLSCQFTDVVKALPGKPFMLLHMAANLPAIIIASEDLCPLGYSNEKFLELGETLDARLGAKSFAFTTSLYRQFTSMGVSFPLATASGLEGADLKARANMHSVVQVVMGINNPFRHGYDAYSDDQVVDQSIGLRVGKGMESRG